MEFPASFSYLPDSLEDSFTASHTLMDTDTFDESLANTLFWHDEVQEQEQLVFPERSASLSTASTITSDSRSSSETNSPPSSASSSLDNDVRDGVKFRLTWPEKGQLRVSSLRGQRYSRSSPVEGSSSTALSQSSPSSGPTDSHHEGSCAKCRMTEVEARKCRLDRRREQNRASQRKFRARKEAKIREAASQVATLEAYVEFLESHNSDLEVLNSELRQRVISLETGKQVSDSAAQGSLRQDLAKKVSTMTKQDAHCGVLPEIRQPTQELYLPLFDHELHPARSSLVAV